ncbi:MAG: HAD family hydrolase [Magnetococcales bacterium]|nr:HAD family hydrolase [Magnetococcales bacterium]MBF0155846.1 HAD family hydrolase [Magnetococcales bacterium]
MPLALFDLDNTLIAGDSDYLWGRFLSQRDGRDGPAYEIRNRQFLREYEQGSLDIHAYLAFHLGYLARKEMTQLLEWRRIFLEEIISPLVLPKGVSLVEEHRHRGDTLVIITATNRFVTEPIAALFGIETLLATEVEMVDGRITGVSPGVPCFREGKVTRLRAWMQAAGHGLSGSHFYSDSHNDLPLLALVERPVVVDPDPKLADHAKRRGWPILSLR